METHECPCCGVIHTTPSPLVRSTSWTDGCACSDINICPYHQINPTKTPERPSDVEMLARAYQRAAVNMERLQEKLKRFAKVKEFLDANK